MESSCAWWCGEPPPPLAEGITFRARANGFSLTARFGGRDSEEVIPCAGPLLLRTPANTLAPAQGTQDVRQRGALRSGGVWASRAGFSLRTCSFRVGRHARE